MSKHDPLPPVDTKIQARYLGPNQKWAAAKVLTSDKVEWKSGGWDFARNVQWRYPVRKEEYVPQTFKPTKFVTVREKVVTTRTIELIYKGMCLDINEEDIPELIKELQNAMSRT